VGKRTEANGRTEALRWHEFWGYRAKTTGPKKRNKFPHDIFYAGILSLAVPSLTMSAQSLVCVAHSLRPHMFSEWIRKKYSLPTTRSVMVMHVRW